MPTWLRIAAFSIGIGALAGVGKALLAGPDLTLATAHAKRYASELGATDAYVHCIVQSGTRVACDLIDHAPPHKVTVLVCAETGCVIRSR